MGSPKPTTTAFRNDPRSQMDVQPDSPWRGIHAAAGATGHPFYLQLSHYAVHGPAQALPETFQKYEQGQRQTVSSQRDLRRLHGRSRHLCRADSHQDRSTGMPTTPMSSTRWSNRHHTTLCPQRQSRIFCENRLRVPLIVRQPGCAPKHLLNVPVVLYDLLPTVVNLAATQTITFRRGRWKLENGVVGRKRCHGSAGHQSVRVSTR